MLKEGFRLVFLDDHAALHQHHTAGYVPGKAHFMRDDQHRHALGRQIPHDGKHLARQFRVKRAGRLVEIDDLRFGCQRPRNRHALLLTAGKLARIRFRPIRQTNLLQHRQADFPRFGFVHLPRDDQPLGHVLQGRPVCEQVVILKDKRRLSANARDLLLSRVRQIERLAIEGHGAAIRRFKEIQTAEQRRLARSAWAENRHHVAAVHRKAHVAQHIRFAERFFDVLHMQHHFARLLPP